MSEMSMRPRFDLEVEQTAEQAMTRLQETLAECDCPCRGDVYDRQIEIRICPPHHHYWSPELNLLVAEQSDDRVRLHGKFGPGPHVWTLFMAGYAAFGMVASAGLLVVLSQWSLDSELWGFWLVLAGIIGCALVYVGARIGQRLASPQMEQIRDLIYETFPEDAPAEPVK